MDSKLKIKSFAMKAFEMMPEETHGECRDKILTGHKFRELFEISDEDIRIIKQEK